MSSQRCAGDNRSSGVDPLARDGADRFERVRLDPTLEAIIMEAVWLVETHGMIPFDAADLTARHRQYDDVEAVIRGVRRDTDWQGDGR